MRELLTEQGSSKQAALDFTAPSVWKSSDAVAFWTFRSSCIAGRYLEPRWMRSRASPRRVRDVVLVLRPLDDDHASFASLCTHLNTEHASGPTSRRREHCSLRLKTSSDESANTFLNTVERRKSRAVVAFTPTLATQYDCNQVTHLLS